MSRKPANPKKLEKGKLIDVQKGFVDTFNWIVDFCRNIKGDESDGCAKIVIDMTQSDKPVVKVEEIYYK